MRQIIFLTAIAIGFFSCNKENENIEYEFYFTLSQNTVAVGDTLLLLMDWRNSQVTGDLDIYAYDYTTKENKIQVPFLELTSDNNVKVIIPIGMCINSVLEVKHANGAVASQELYKPYSPIIKSISPLSGKGGDIITISGHEFLSGGNMKVVINSMVCQTVELNDSNMRVKVPVGCGNGRFSIYGFFLGGTYNNPEFTYNEEFFEYEWESENKKALSSVLEYSTRYKLHRDSNGKVLKITNDLYKGTYEDYEHSEYLIYDNNGFIDTIYTVGPDFRHYTVFARNSNNTIITASRYSMDDSFLSKTEIILNEGIVSFLEYYDYGGSHYTKQFRYSTDTLFVIKTYLDENLNPTNEYTDTYLVDNSNGLCLDLGIKGYNNLLDGLMLHVNFEFPVRTKFFGGSIIKYNESGQILNWETSYPSSSGTGFDEFNFEYE